MLKGVLEQHAVMTTTLCPMSKNVMCLIQEEVDFIRNDIALHGLFEQVTREMSVEKIKLHRRFNKVLQMFHTGTAILLDFRFERLSWVPFADENNLKAVEERLLEMMRGSYSGV